MKNKYALGVIVLLLFGFAQYAHAEDLGKIRIPEIVKLKGELIQPGTYTFSLERETSDLMIRLSQNGAVVASELAVTKPAEKVHDPAHIVYQPLKQDSGKSPMSRILCSYQGTLYLLYFDKP